MEGELRKKKLDEIKQNESIYMTGIRIRYEGQTQEFVAYRIPLEYLVYNKYNGRIGSLVKSFEVQHHTLNEESPEDEKIIEKFLWEFFE